MLSPLAIYWVWAQYDVVRRAWRKRKSILGGRALFRYGICAVLLAAVCSIIVKCSEAIKDGEILVAVPNRFSRSVAITVHRADNPSGFWEAICVYGFIGVMFLHLALAEIMIGIRERRHATRKSSV